MHEICLVCLQRDEHVHESYHKRCMKELFGKPTLPKLEVERANLHLIGLEMAGQVSLSGVQEKISLGLDARMNLRMLGPGGRYILKPESGSYPELPANEQLCMRIARIMGVEVARTGLMKTADGSLALIVKRFDRTDAGDKLPMEDFCQLAQKLPREKYTGSAELTAKLVAEHSSQPPLDGLALWRAWLISWLLGNGDLHLKNLALLGSSGNQKLAPLYDLVSTIVVLPQDTLAMPLAGKKDNLKAVQWMDLAGRCQLVPETIALEVRRMLLAAGSAMELVHNAPLSDELKLPFAQHLVRRLEGLELLHAHADSMSTRRLRHQRAATEPTAAGIARTCSRLHAGLVALGFQEEDLPLQSQLTELAWLARGKGSLFREGGPWAEDQGRATSGLLEWLRLESLSRTLHLSPPLPGIRAVLRHLKQEVRVTTGTRVAGQPGNRLFELEVAAALARVVPGQISLNAEPHDLLFLEPDGRKLAFECKRPATRKNLPKLLHDAINTQLGGMSQAGYVVISLDGFEGDHWIEASGLEEARDQAKQDMQKQMGGSLEQEILKALPAFDPDLEIFPPGAMGVLVLKTYGFLLSRKGGGAHIRLHVEVCSVAHAGRPKELLEFTFATLLRGGMEQALVG